MSSAPSTSPLLDPFATREVWFLTGSQDLYGEETLAQVAEQSQRVASLLDDAGAVPVRVVWKPVVKSSDAIRRVMLEASADDSVAGVITWMHTFSPARMWIAGLSVLSKPLLHLHTQADPALPWATIDMDFMNLNQAAHGDREFGYVLSRLRSSRTTVAGYAGDAGVQQRVGEWARAAVAASVARSLKLVRFGDTMRNVAVTEGDKVEAQIRWGVDVEALGVNALADVVLQVSDAEADALVAEYADRYEVAPELLPGAERAESLHYGAKIEVALRRVLEANGAEAFTTNFEDLGTLRQLPGLAVQRLLGDGYGFAGEGDWKTAALTRVLKAAGAGLPGGTAFMEDYTYDLAPGQPQRILGAHMLEVCPTITTSTPRIEVHPLGIGDREDPVRMVHTADPGDAVIVGWCDLGERFRLVANEVRVVTPPQDLPNLPVARAVWEPLPDWRTSTECWLEAGGPHHTVMSTQFGLEVLEDLADVVGTELAVIGAGTTTRSFKRELRWEGAYRVLQRGV